MGGLFSHVFEIQIKETDIGMKREFSGTLSESYDLVIQNRGRVVMITGAGISSKSLPTFRSRDHSGLWDVLSAPILSKSQFYQNPLPSWRIAANVRNLQIRKVLEPSLAHKVIHQLVIDGYVSTILTQNCDSLHTFHDAFDSKIVELHGSIGDFGDCETCHAKKPVDTLMILEKDESPRCPTCNSVLKPPVAFFEEKIPRSIREAAYSAMSNCDILVLVGTYCAVDPVLSLAEAAKRNGTILVEINPETTQGTAFMDISLRGTADSIFEELATMLYPGKEF